MRLSGVAAGVMLAGLLVVAGGLANLIPLTGLAALLTVIGVSVMLSEGRTLLRAWHVSRPAAFMAFVTILVGLTVDLTAAIFAGVVLSLVLFALRAANETRVVELRPEPDGTWTEIADPAPLAPGEARVFEVQGPLYYASVHDLDRLLPLPEAVAGGTLILRVRGRAFEGLTGLEWLRSYAGAITARGGRLVLSGAGPEMMAALKDAPVDLHPATDRLFASTCDALAAAGIDRGVARPQ